MRIGLVCLAAATVAEIKFQADSTQILVMSYNTRYENPDDGINRLDNRKERVANLIHFHAPGILCLQEALNYHIMAYTDEDG